MMERGWRQNDGKRKERKNRSERIDLLRNSFKSRNISDLLEMKNKVLCQNEKMYIKMRVCA